MKKRLFAMFLLLVVAVMPVARAEEKMEAELTELYEKARVKLEAAGLTITDMDIFRSVSSDLALAKREQEMSAETEHVDLIDSLGEPGEIAYHLLFNMGIGVYIMETTPWIWKPTSTQVYALFAQAKFDSSMYTEFFQGVNAIVPGAPFTEVTEDMSGRTEDWGWSEDSPNGQLTDGYRSVSFRCNGQPYCLTLESYGNSLNLKIIEETNRILQEQGFPDQLHTLSLATDKEKFVLLLIYGTEEKANQIQQVIDEGLVREEKPEDKQGERPKDVQDTLIEKIFPFLVR